MDEQDLEGVDRQVIAPCADNSLLPEFFRELFQTPEQDGQQADIRLVVDWGTGKPVAVMINRSGRWGDDRIVRLRSRRDERLLTLETRVLTDAGAQFAAPSLAPPTPEDLFVNAAGVFTEPGRAAAWLVSKVAQAALIAQGVHPSIAKPASDFIGQALARLWADDGSGQHGFLEGRRRWTSAMTRVPAR